MEVDVAPVDALAAAEADCEQHNARLRLLSEATETLTAGVDAEQALDRLAELIVPEWSDLVLAALFDDDGLLRTVTLRCADADGPEPHDLSRPVRDDLVEHVLTGGGAERLDREAIAALGDGTRACLDALQVTSVIVCPLRVRDEQLGVLVTATVEASERTYDDDDLTFMVELSGRASQAVDHARLFDTMRVAETRFRLAVEFAPIGVGLISAAAEGGHPEWIEANPALCEILGRTRRQVVGHADADFAHPEDRREHTQRLRRLLTGKGERCAAELRLLRSDGEARWVCVQATTADPSTVVVQVQDVTDLRRSQDELEHLASHDPLTGALNRPGFETALDRAVADTLRHGDEGAVAVLDLDGFKALNDVYGVAVGDEVLRTVAKAMAGRLRETDALGRLGDDEFGVVLPRTGPEPAAAVVRELLECVCDVAVPCGEALVRVSASAGLRTYRPSTARRAAVLIGEADVGMLDAKEDGGNRLTVVEPETGCQTQSRTRMRWSERIRHALEHDRFVLFEQPIMRVEDRVIDGSELLLRMVDDDGEPLAPGLFLPAAERHQQTAAIDAWVVDRALQLLADRRDAGVPGTLNVNLSGPSLTDEAVMDRIASGIRDAGIDGSQLTLEITETEAVDNFERASGLLARLADLGCVFALDDFGSGFASFAYLKNLPVRVLKIDGQFIRELPSSHADQVTVRAIADAARGLGVRTVAEFVESEAILDTLQRFGIDRAQGFHVGRPRPARLRPAWLQTGQVWDRRPAVG